MNQPEETPAETPISLAELADSYSAAMRRETGNNWARGDIAIEITARNEAAQKKGSKVDLIREFLELTGENVTSFRTRRWVAEKFPDGTMERTLPLDWTMFRIAADTDDPTGWLRLAIDKGWTCRQLIEELDSNKARKKVRSGAQCACGCGAALPEAPVFAGGVPGVRGRYFFTSVRCLQTWTGPIIADLDAQEAEKNGLISDVIHRMSVAAVEALIEKPPLLRSAMDLAAEADPFAGENGSCNYSLTNQLERTG